jgi:hypothetical protein
MYNDRTSCRTLANYLFKIIARAMCTEVATFQAAHPRLTGISCHRTFRPAVNETCATVSRPLTERSVIVMV